MHFPLSWRVIALMASVKFIYILDFMMLMPLGPDLSRALGFPTEHVGWLSAAYTMASMVAGIVSVRMLDRFDRKQAFLVCFAVLLVATGITSLASDMTQLLWLRALTGLAGAPAVAVGMAIVVDTFAPEQRGVAIGKVMLGFSLAAVVGIPLVLELSRIGGWQTPFVFVAGLGALVWTAALLWLPATTAGGGSAVPVSPLTLLRQSAVRKACLIQAGSQFSAFLVVPHFSAFFLLNLQLPREYLGSLYLAGGIAAMAMMQVLGRITDRSGAQVSVAIATACTLAGLMPFFGVASLPLVIPFVLFMAGNAGRNVSIAAMTSQVPYPHERAGYIALEGTVQDFSVTMAALVATAVLGSSTSGALTNTTTLALMAATLVLATLIALVRWQPALQRGN
mgnify:CR=1 FL=1